SSVTTWLLSIARYKALAELRRRRAPPSDAVSAQRSDPEHDPEASFEIKHRGEILRNCLTRLSPRHREIIDLGAGGRRHSGRARQYRQNPHVPRPQTALRAARRARHRGRAGIASLESITAGRGRRLG